MTAALAVLALVTGVDVVERHQCFRCHDGASSQQHDRELQCAGCHRALSSGALDAQRQRYPPAVWERFVRRTGEHYVNVPPLTGLSRLRTSWLVAFLRAPYDLRPRLSETMIPTTLNDAELAELARRFGTQVDEPPPPRPSAARLAEGRAQFEALGCAGCHEAAAPTAVPTQVLAPNLTHTRDRMNFGAVVRYLIDPRAVNPSSQMPAAPRDPAQARVLAEYVVFGDLPRAAVTATAPPPYQADAGAPTYDEVEARVFKKVCWHCHANPDFANGNGGPGMSGGFGYPARGLSFASFAEVMNGSRDDQGRAQSIFRPGQSGEPVLLEVLRTRYREEAGRATGAPLGMPMGLPALAPDDFALVERWVRGGRRPPRPKTRPASEPALPTLSR